MGLLRNSIPGLAKGDKILPSEILGGGVSAAGRAFWVKASGDSTYAQFFADHNVVEDNINSVYNTIDAAVNACTANRGDVIFVDPGSYDETVTADVAGITIIGLGGRGAAFIEPSTAGAEGLDVLADDITIINLGVAGDDTGDYALRVGSQTVSPDRFRAYGCKFELADGAGATVICKGSGDALFEDCESAYAASGILFDDNDDGYATQIRIVRHNFHNLTTVHVGVATGGLVKNLRLADCIHDNAEDGTAPTDYILLSDNANTGIITGCKFATATNATGVLTIGTGIKWVANETEAGVSTARPA